VMARGCCCSSCMPPSCSERCGCCVAAAAAVVISAVRDHFSRLENPAIQIHPPPPASCCKRAERRNKRIDRVDRLNLEWSNVDLVSRSVRTKAIKDNAGTHPGGGPAGEASRAPPHLRRHRTSVAQRRRRCRCDRLAAAAGAPVPARASAPRLPPAAAPRCSCNAQLDMDEEAVRHRVPGFLHSCYPLQGTSSFCSTCRIPIIRCGALVTPVTAGI